MKNVDRAYEVRQIALQLHVL